jgi:AraC-like DNA-binding protein
MDGVSFSTAAIERRQKLDAWRDILSKSFGPIEVSRNSDHDFTGSVHTTRRVQLQFNEISYRGQTLERTASNLARFDQEYFTFGRPISGPLMFEQNGRVFPVTPGCLVLLNQTSPYKATAEADYHAYSISIPRALLSQRHPQLGSFYKLDMADGSPRGQLLAGFAKYMTEGIEQWSEAEAISLREQMLDLIVLLMINPKDGLPAYETSVQAAHRERAIAFIKRNHCNAGITPASIAAGCGISVNYLHKIFQGAGLQPEQFVYAQRLETCRNLLLDPAHREKTVKQIAYKTGFSHPSHLSRMFKQKFGMSPAEFRASRAPAEAPEK